MYLCLVLRRRLWVPNGFSRYICFVDGLQHVQLNVFLCGVLFLFSSSNAQPVAFNAPKLATDHFICLTMIIMRNDMRCTLTFICCVSIGVHIYAPHHATNEWADDQSMIGKCSAIIENNKSLSSCIRLYMAVCVCLNVMVDANGKTGGGRTKLYVLSLNRFWEKGKSKYLPLLVAYYCDSCDDCSDCRCCGRPAFFLPLFDHLFMKNIFIHVIKHQASTVCAV